MTKYGQITMKRFSSGPPNRFNNTINVIFIYIFILFAVFIHITFIQLLKYLLMLLFYTLLA